MCARGRACFLAVRGGVFGDREAADGVLDVAELGREFAEGHGGVMDDRDGLARDGLGERGTGAGERAVELPDGTHRVGLQREGECAGSGARRELQDRVARRDDGCVSAMAELLDGELDEGLGAFFWGTGGIAGRVMEVVEDEVGWQAEAVSEVLVGR